jgi:tetratricopeptide (TPR) repeat protein
VAYERFKEARAQKHPEEEMRQHLNAALGYYQQALALFPPTAVNELAVTHNSLGEIWRAASDIERTVPHYNKSIRYAEAAQNFYKAAGTRYNVALLFAQQGRFEDALLYAHAARRDYARYGAGAAQDVEKMEGLIAEIEEARKKRGG